MDAARARLRMVHSTLSSCALCPQMIGPVVHGPLLLSKIFLLGQAPGPHEGKLGRPFAWTAGKTLFRWFEEGLGVSEEQVRERVYFAAVARCFPGKAAGGGDRKPSPTEIARCRPHLEREIEVLVPDLVIPVGTMAIEQVLGAKRKLVDVVGTVTRVRYLGTTCDAIALPHPSGASPWHRSEPGVGLLKKAFALLQNHPAVRAGLLQKPARYT